VLVFCWLRLCLAASDPYCPSSFPLGTHSRHSRGHASSFDPGGGGGGPAIPASSPLQHQQRHLGQRARSPKPKPNKLRLIGGAWLSKGGTNADARDRGGRGGVLLLVLVVRDVVPRRGPAAGAAGAEAGTALAPCCVRLEAAATTMTGDRTRPWGCWAPCAWWGCTVLAFINGIEAFVFVCYVCRQVGALARCLADCKDCASIYLDLETTTTTTTTLDPLTHSPPSSTPTPPLGIPGLQPGEHSLNIPFRDHILIIHIRISRINPQKPLLYLQRPFKRIQLSQGHDVVPHCEHHAVWRAVVGWDGL